MKSIVAFALVGAFLLVAVEAANSATSTDTKDSTQGLSGFPVISLSGFNWKNKINKIVKTFNEYAGSTTAYTTEQVNNLMKINGDIIVATKEGETMWLDSVYIDRYGRIFSDIGQEIKGARGIIGGNKNRLENTSDSAFEKIKDGFKQGEAVLSSIPNDIWVFGKASFEHAATIAAETAKMITQLGADVWDKFVPLSQAPRDDLHKLVQSGMNLAIEPARLLTEGAGAGFNAMKDMFGVAAGVPLAMGSSVARTGADIVSTGAGLFGRMADSAFGFGQNMAGLNKQKK